MYKLQVVLVPPHAQQQLQFLHTPSANGGAPTFNAGTMSAANPNHTVNANSSKENLMNDWSFARANTPLQQTLTQNLKKFLLFSKPSITLLDLAQEITDKCYKLYPELNQQSADIEIMSLRDVNNCDLDPDFLVKDVFALDNTVNVILKSDLPNFDQTSIYSSLKKRKLGSNGTNSIGVLNIAKKRQPGNNQNSQVAGSRSLTNTNAIRISTPLARQLYPPPISNRYDGNSDMEAGVDDDEGDKSFLPPPLNPQSPPIRISSGIGNQVKQIRAANTGDDSVSKSETVDPDKSKQQRLSLLNTPVISAVTPNRVTLTGQRVVSDTQYNLLQKQNKANSPKSIFENQRSGSSLPNGSAQRHIGNPNTMATPRIISGMLVIPEPKISEVEQRLKEGPSSPSSLLPAKPDQIPMKKPHGNNENEYNSSSVSSTSSSSSSIADEQHNGMTLDDSEHNTKFPAQLQRTTSIADGNGSPMRNNISKEDGKDKIGEKAKSKEHSDRNFHLAELPGKTYKPKKTLSQNEMLIGITAECIAEENESDSEHNDTVRFVPSSPSKSSKANDIPTLKQFAGEKITTNADIPRDLVYKLLETDDSSETKQIIKENYDPNITIRLQRKPYTTVLYKDIDNSKPDPRNIMPSKGTRNAAIRAAKLLASKNKKRENGNIDNEQEDDGEFSTSGSSTGIESDLSSDSEPNENTVRKNDTKTVEINPLKEKVVGSDPKHFELGVDEAQGSADVSKMRYLGTLHKNRAEISKSDTNEKSSQLKSTKKATNVPKYSKKPNSTKTSEDVETNNSHNTNVEDKTQDNIKGNVASLNNVDISENSVPIPLIANQAGLKEHSRNIDIEKTNPISGHIDNKSNNDESSRAIIAPRETVVSKTLKDEANVTSDSSSAATSSSSSSSDDSSGDEISKSKLSRRLVVAPPKGAITTISSKRKISTAAKPDTNVSRFTKSGSQNAVDQDKKFEGPQSETGLLDDLPQKLRPSLSSLSDLVNRGIPDVKDNNTSKINGTKPSALKARTTVQSVSTDVTNQKDDDDENKQDTDESSESSSDSSLDSNSSTSSSSDDDDDEFISAKSASAALGKKKKLSGGFASLVRDLQKQ